ncbi:hypothetical protein BGZ63DRAFT_454790 [Mariannaea sp. PMI_226]|nr:hypothetical protein BGZ63DRAFT_454790 [Mariannaea sp. PMI_226]
MACEQFGNTLAISQDTVIKIEHCVVLTPEPAILTFLKSTVGYSANDCISYLSKSLAGLQFLGLATALVTFTDLYRAAGALQAMLVCTAKDKTLVPTVRQVKDLLVSIEPRCHRAGFADDAFGWELLLARHPMLRCGQGDTYPNGILQAPGDHALENLVDALRQLNRIGAADIVRVTVRTTSCAAWTIAFVKWSLGCPPSVVSGDTNVPILEQPESRVTVIIPTDVQDKNWDFSITIHSSIHGPSNLVAASQQEPTAGMISLQTYGQLLLQRYDFDVRFTRKAFQEAIPYSLHTAMKRLSRSPVFPKSSVDDTGASRNFEKTGQEKGVRRQKIPPASFVDALRLNPFRGESSISRIYELLFKEKLDLIRTQGGIDISNLPDVKPLLKDCGCRNCNSVTFTDINRFGPCLEGMFKYQLDGIVGELLALSLFDCPDLLQVSSDALGGHYGFSGLSATRLPYNQGDRNIELSNLLDRTMQILGHRVRMMDGHHWVISSAKGQAVWPTIYEVPSYGKRGYLSLSWHPGVVSHQGETYNLANFNGSSLSKLDTDPITRISKNEVQKPCNLCPGLRLDWTVSASENSLHVALSVESDSKKYRSTFFDPTDALKTLANALLVEHCRQDTNAKLDSSNLLLKFSGPLEPVDEKAEVSVVAVDGDDGLRFMALCAAEGGCPVVLRNRACLACCLEVCQNTGSKVVIL